MGFGASLLAQFVLRRYPHSSKGTDRCGDAAHGQERERLGVEADVRC